MITWPFQSRSGVLTEGKIYDRLSIAINDTNSKFNSGITTDCFAFASLQLILIGLNENTHTAVFLISNIK